MASRGKCGVIGSYSERLAALNEIESEMGERASFLADLADALCHFPDSVEIGANHIDFAGRRIEAAEWSSFRDIGTLFHTWREQRASVDAMWAAMSVEERTGLSPPAPVDADPTRAWV